MLLDRPPVLLKSRGSMLALAIVIGVTTGGAAATYLYDDSSTLTTRLAAGACLGLAMLGLTGFVAASLLGFGAPRC